MRIIQITDLHVGLAGEETFEVDVRANFLQVCRKIQELAPDYLVVSGDLCFEDAHQEIYTWLKQHLDQLEITYDLISGNHDEPKMLATCFEREHLLVDGKLYFKRQLEGQSYLFLDTTNGKIEGKQLEWLRDTLKSEIGRLIIFMHHPPVLARVPHMDGNYPMQNRDEILDLFLDYPDQIDIFCGHYHVDRAISTGNVNIYITPSTFFQMNQQSSSFAVDHRRPGMRLIEVAPEHLYHSTIYV